MAPLGAMSTTSSLSYDVFTELDPLGTGRSKPYVDKKLFFQELKNPPKKVLKDLVPVTCSATLLADILPPITTNQLETVKNEQGYNATITSVPRHSGGSVSIGKPSGSIFPGSMFALDPFAETDPFDSADPFSDTFKDDPFVGNLHEFPNSSVVRNDEVKRKSSRDHSINGKSEERSFGDGGRNVFNGPLQVTLPPEPIPKSPRPQRQVSFYFVFSISYS